MSKLFVLWASLVQFRLLLQPSPPPRHADVPGLVNPALVEQCRSEVSSALLNYCSVFSDSTAPSLAPAGGGGAPSLPPGGVGGVTSDKFGQLLLELSEIKLTSLLMEGWLYQQHLANNTTEGTLLVEILNACQQ